MKEPATSITTNKNEIKSLIELSGILVVIESQLSMLSKSVTSPYIVTLMLSFVLSD